MKKKPVPLDLFLVKNNKYQLDRLKTAPNCGSCLKTFKPSKLYQIYCCEKCEDKTKQALIDLDKELYEGICLTCGLKFRKVRGRANAKVCETCKRTERREYNKEKYKLKPKKEPKPKKVVPYSELNKRAEYKRVFDDSGWKHFLKGRVWDKI